MLVLAGGRGGTPVMEPISSMLTITPPYRSIGLHVSASWGQGWHTTLQVCMLVLAGGRGGTDTTL